eukprot:scaffold7662_cov77-Skeletonema_dohrnii-CCMP3373.AAC.1
MEREVVEGDDGGDGWQLMQCRRVAAGEDADALADGRVVEMGAGGVAVEQPGTGHWRELGMAIVGGGAGPPLDGLGEFFVGGMRE